MVKNVFKLTLILSLLVCPLFSDEKKKEQSENNGVEQIQHEITVTATRIETPAREVASSVTVITRQDIERSTKTTVLDILNEALGITLVQNGPTGAAASVHIRGGNAEHTLVMMDGLELNDPITPSRSIDLAHCSLDNVERIEIIRGPQSTLYGSDALSGVINIITRKGEGQPSIGFSAQGGSYGAFSGSTSLSGSTEKLHYAFGTSFSQNAGFSAANRVYEGNVEKDGYNNLTLSGRLGFFLSESFEIDLTARRVETEIDIDNFGGAFGDDPNNRQTYDSLFLKGQALIRLWNNRWEQKFHLALIDYDRTYKNPTDENHPYDSEEAFYKSTLFKVDWQHNLYLHQTNTLTLGVDFQREQGESRYESEGLWGPYLSLFPLQKAHITGFYIQDQIRIGGRLFTTLGTRLDIHSQFGSSITGRAAAAYTIEGTGTKLKASIGTGFKSPSLYQLFAPGTLWGPIGNENLHPERSVGRDIGFEQEFLDSKIFLAATYFSHVYKNLIDFDYLFGYVNIDQADAKGLEFSFLAFPFPGLTLKTNYTREKARDRETGESLLRRPTDHLHTNLGIHILKRARLDLSVDWVGKRDDMEYVGFTSQRVAMSSFTLVNSAISLELTANANVFLRLQNLFNAQYEVIKGFGTPGFSVYVGAKLHF